MDLKVYIIERDKDKALEPYLWEKFNSRKFWSRILNQMVKKYKDGYLIWDWNWNRPDLKIESYWDLYKTKKRHFNLNFERITCL